MSEKIRLGRFVRLVALTFGLAIFPLLLVFSTQGESAAPEPGFSTFYGGSTEECLFDRCAITHDSEGNIIIAGTTRSPDFPLVNEFASNPSAGSTEDIFLVKLTPDGQTVLFSTYVAQGSVRDVALDGNDNIWVTGDTTDRDFPTTANAFQDCNAGGVKGVVLQMSADGQDLLQATCLRGDGTVRAYGIDLDPDGNVLVAGQTSADDFPLANPVQDERAGLEDMFVAKFSADLSQLLFSTYLGTPDRDYAWDVSSDASGNIFIGGRTPEPESFPQTPGTVGPDGDVGWGAVAKFSPTGQLLYSTTFGDVTDEATMIEADDDGNLYILWNNLNGIAKLTPDGSAFLYRTIVDVEISESATYGGMTIDSRGNAYLIGRANSDSGNRKEIVVAALHRGGRQVYYETLGGSLDDTGYDVSVRENPDGTIDAAMVATTRSANFPLLNPIQDTLPGTQNLAIFDITGLEQAVNVEFTHFPVIIRP